MKNLSIFLALCFAIPACSSGQETSSVQETDNMSLQFHRHPDAGSDAAQGHWL